MTAVGGENQSVTVEGRERYGINVRYARDYREDLPALRRVLLPAARAGGPDPHGGDRRRGAGAGPVDDPRRERPAGRLRLRGLRHLQDRRRHATSSERSGGAPPRCRCRPGYSMAWSGQYENMLRVTRAAEVHPAADAGAHLRAAVHEHALGVQGGDRDAGGPVLGDRRGLAALAARLQRLDRGLGGDDRAAWASTPRPACSCCCSSTSRTASAGAGAAEDAKGIWWRRSSTAP